MYVNKKMGNLQTSKINNCLNEQFNKQITVSHIHETRNSRGSFYSIFDLKYESQKASQQIITEKQISSFQKINYPSKTKSKYSQKISKPQNSYQNELIKQLQIQYENISNYKIHQSDQNDADNKNSKTQNIPFISSQQLNFSKNQQQKQFLNQNYKKFSEIIQHHQKQQEPQSFKIIRQSETLQDQQQEQLQSPTHPKSNFDYGNQFMKQKNIQSQCKPGEKKYGRYSTVKQQKNNIRTKGYEQIFYNFKNENLQLPLNFQKNKNKKLVVKGKDNVKNVSSNNTSGKSDSNHHPVVFRNTLQYVDGGKYDFSGLISENSKKSQVISSQSSQSQGPRTNIDQKPTYRFKYKKYKQKYLNLIQVIHQLQNLNETLIQDQRQNYNYYQNTIKSLQNLLIIKDKQIQQLNDIIQNLNHNNQNSKLCSIEDRQKQVDHYKLKKQIENKNKEIKSLKQNIESMDESFQQTQKNQSGTAKHFEKKISILKKQKEVLQKKNKTLEQINLIYQQKIKDKQGRVSNLSAFNSQLQQEILKLKDKIHCQKTNDTDRDFGMTFLKKENIYLTGQISQMKARQDKQTQIQRHLEAIDQQIRLIRKRVVKSSSAKEQNTKRQVKNQNQYLNLISQFELEESISQKQQNNYLNQLKDMVEKLQSFKDSI